MSNPIAAENSTNVRITLLVALSLWGAAVAGGSIDGVFAKLSEAELVALALFAFVYPTATYLLDRSLRGFARSASGFAGTLLVLDIALAIAVRAACAATETWTQLLVTTPFTLVGFFAAPLVLALHVAAADRALHPETSGHGLRGDLA